MKNFKRLLPLIMVIGAMITMATSCPPTSQPPKPPGPIPHPDTSYLVPANDIAQLSYNQANDSTNSLAAETINRNELISVLQGMNNSASNNVTLQFVISPNGEKHLAVYQTKVNFAPTDTMWIFSAFATKCPPTCGAYSATVLDTAKLGTQPVNNKDKK